MKTLLLQNWKFTLNADDAPIKSIDMWQPDADDSQWQDVVVPHDWAVTLPFSTANSSGTGYLPGGTGWYRTAFTVPSGWNGESAFIHFDGVYKNSQVWCNGYYLGKRPFGYANFKYDISHCLREGDNILAVKVTHEDIADSRWYTGSGIYRKVFVRFYDPVYIDETTVFVRSGSANDESPADADVIISGKVHCGNMADTGALRITARLTAAEGKTFGAEILLAPCTEPCTAKTCKVPFEMTVPVSKPQLWSPDSPNLYTLNLEIHAEGTKEPLSAIPPLRTGIRSFSFDPDRGFFLNGKSMKMRGVCVHHDAGCLGAAVWPDVWRRRLEKLKAAGCNAIRMSHNPHMEELYDLCDEIGFLVIDEAFDEWEGCKNKWWQGHNVYPPKHQRYAEDFIEWHERDLAAMVVRDRNHPSVIMWSIGNEIDYPNDPYVHPLFMEMTGNNDANKPAAERQYNRNKPNMERLATIAANLARIVKQHDTTRPVTLAAAFPELSSRLGFYDALDVVGYNYKEQFYGEDHKRFPALPIMGSENSHSLDAWKAVRDNDYISSQFLWTGIDYLGEAHGWPIRCSGAGILDTAGNEKTAFYRRKALWTDIPMLYLATRLKPESEESKQPRYEGEIPPWHLFRCWDYLPGKIIEVACYTNLNEAELFCNGKSLGKGKRGDDSTCILWTIPFERGEISVRGIGADVTDTLESTLPPVQLRLSKWQPAGSGQTAVQNGQYRIIQIEAELLDENGRLCVRGNSGVFITLNGPARFLGMENGDIADCTEYRSATRRLNQGRLIIYALIDTAVKEHCTLTASVPGIAPTDITLNT